ncbi:hypothetical protein EON64_18130 [archaeon]|nr:MAG: hypothetical protein EON64_18130 [archaeon]
MSTHNIQTTVFTHIQAQTAKKTRSSLLLHTARHRHIQYVQCVIQPRSGAYMQASPVSRH